MPRSRRLLTTALTVLICAAIAACSTDIPNSTLNPNSQFGRDTDRLFDWLLLGGAIVFTIVEVGVLFTIILFRRRGGKGGRPRQVYGNATLEITWTLIPAAVLAFIAVPTVRTIFKYSPKNVPADALKVEVIGHQWWWEFRYTDLGVTTANELVLPVGRTANFALTSKDVIHSFWIPSMSGKRDVIANRTNYIYFKPDSAYAWNGFCAEFCGTSHANMRFKVFTVSPAQFDAWIAHQKTGPQFGGGTDSITAGGSSAAPALAAFTNGKLPPHLVPSTPVPKGLAISNVTGNATRGAQLYKTGACIACHVIQGVSPGIVGPNLTHFGSRTSLASGLYPNDPRHLALWIKNAPAMKPGSLMPALGRSPGTPAGYTDQQVADIAAYLLALK
ncbi:MAG: cytochrome c oxidase subunit II [Anaerolineae bacterium]|nr:cytochrome c oxidase subunit II [Gemmatimonadaceae bacterium]